MNKKWLNPEMTGAAMSALIFSALMSFLVFIIFSHLTYAVEPMLEIAPDVKWTGEAAITISLSKTAWFPYIVTALSLIFPITIFLLRKFNLLIIIILIIQFAATKFMVQIILFGFYDMQNQMMIAGGII